MSPEEFYTFAHSDNFINLPKEEKFLKAWIEIGNERQRLITDFINNNSIEAITESTPLQKELKLLFKEASDYITFDIIEIANEVIKLSD
jgi:hypothetical protein